MASSQDARRGRAGLSLWLVPASLLMLACPGNPPPQPPNPCDACTPEQTCVEGSCVDPHTEACQALLDSGLPWCDQAGMTCGECAHNPSSDPRHCEKAQDCPTDPPPVDPLPGACRDVESTLVVSTGCSEVFRTRVKVATTALGDLTGNDPQDNLKTLAAKLIEQNPGMCAFGGIEAVFILRNDGRWEENHTVFFGDGGWTNNGFGKYKGCHEDTNPGPPPGACGAPVPPPLSHFRGPAEKPCNPGQCCDATPYVCDDDGTYCRAVGFTDGRRCCSVRTEGAEDREACERLVLGGGAVWTSDTGTFPCNDNHLRAKCRGSGCSWIQVCDTPGAVCNRKDW